MIRAIGTILGIFCAATLLTEVLALAVLWYSGTLSAESLSEIAAIVSGRPQIEQGPPAAAAADLPPDVAEIKRERAIRILDLDSRENELALLKEMTTRAANDLIEAQQAFEEQRRTFLEELAALDAQRTSEATEQARAILLALPPAEAVEQLMGLSLEENVTLLKGMPERSIAKILQGFSGSDERVERGLKVFEAISRGTPAAETLQQALDQAQGP